jgi:hypothetical protein
VIDPPHPQKGSYWQQRPSLSFHPDSDDFLAFLDSPVPFCFGFLNTERRHKFPLTPDITIVRLDER